MVDEFHVCEVMKDGRVMIYNNTDQEQFSDDMTSETKWSLSEAPPHFFFVKLSTDVF